MKKKTYYVEFWNKKEQICNTFVKAHSEYEAEQTFYKKYPYYLVRKISLL